MRKLKTSSLFTPLMRISIILTISILIATASYGLIDTFYWLALSLISWGIAFLFYKNGNISQQCISLYISIFFLGGLFTSHQMDKKQESIQIISEEDLSSFDRTLMLAQDVRNHIQCKMKRLNIKDQDFAVISAMTLGDKTALTKETKDIYSLSGASHTLAISGLHIGIIFQIFILLMGRRRRSTFSIFLSLIAIWGYVIFIGMPTSAIRSATMISAYSFALLAHRKALSINNLCFAYVVMLLFNPLYLFDISFQMSFMAVFAILLFVPALQESIFAKRFTKTIWGMFYMSLAAQIGTIPLIAYYFGRISTYSLITSFIAIPATTLILYLSVTALFLGLFTLIPYLSYLTTPLLHFVASCLVGITQFCNTVLHLTTHFPGASIENITINIPQLCLIYLGIIMGYLLFKKSSVLWKKKDENFLA